MPDEPRKLTQLGSNANDRAAAILKGVAGAVPFVGSALAEIVNVVIPNQRLDRVERFLTDLAAELGARRGPSGGLSNDDTELQIRLTQPSNTDLILRGIGQASHAMSQERLHYIVQCVANGIASEERGRMHHSRMLSLMEELDDEELAILAGISSRRLEHLRPMPSDDNMAFANDQAMFGVAQAKLDRMGLIEFKQRVAMLQTNERGRPEDVAVPLEDGHWKITEAGKMVLVAIGFKKPEKPSTLADFL